MSSSFPKSSTPSYSSLPFDLATPPPHPPKTPRSKQSTSDDGPPPPPPPNRSSPHSSSQPQQTPQPLPPDPSENWVPAILLDKPYMLLLPLCPTPLNALTTSNKQKRSSALAPILSSQPLISALAQMHPSVSPSPLPPHLSTTAELATHLQSQHAYLLSLRRDTQQHLLQLHSMERAWKKRQKEIDAVLEPWSAKVFYRRLGVAEREAEELSRGLEESFLEGEGRAGERELGEFVRRYREGRGVIEKRRAWRERWEEGKVLGWSR